MKTFSNKVLKTLMSLTIGDVLVATLIYILIATLLVISSVFNFIIVLCFIPMMILLLTWRWFECRHY